jgi:hypothetical protein
MDILTVLVTTRREPRLISDEPVMTMERDAENGGQVTPSLKTKVAGAAELEFRALPLVLWMFDEWKSRRNDQAALLGLRVRSLQSNLNGRLPSLSQDQVIRLSLISGIYQALRRTFPPQSAERWFKHPQHGAPFHDRTPLAYARESGIPGLYAMRRLLDAAAHRSITSNPDERHSASRLGQPAIDLSNRSF